MAAVAAESKSDAMAAEPDAGADAWMYCVEGAQRGPLPGHALLKLLERGVVPMTCLVWRPEQEGWQGLLAGAILCAGLPAPPKRFDALPGVPRRPGGDPLAPWMPLFGARFSSRLGVSARDCLAARRAER